MADVKTETLKHDIAEGICVKFQRNPHIFCIEQHSGTLVRDDVRVSEKSKMAAWKRKLI